MAQRELAIPLYPDDGCRMAPSCLDCPLPTCWFEMTDGEKDAYGRQKDKAKRERDSSARRTRKAETKAAAQPGWVIDEQKAVELLRPDPETLDDNSSYRTLGRQSVGHGISADPAQVPVSGPPVLSDDDRARIEAALAKGRSLNTRRVYRGMWSRWTSWAADRGVSCMPASPQHIAAFLTDMADAGASISSVKAARSAIATAHRETGEMAPTANKEVSRVLTRSGAPPKQAPGITRDRLASIAAVADFPRLLPGGSRESQARARARARVDVALITVMRDGMLRRSEAAAITWENVGWAPDGSGRLRVLRSGAGKGWDVLYLGPAAAAALAAVRPQGAAPQDLVFQLSEVQIHRRIRDAARAAGLDGAFSGDSPRAGMAMDLAAAGFTMHDLMIAGRWSSTAMAARFTRSLAEAGGPVNRYYSRAGAALA